MGKNRRSQIAREKNVAHNAKGMVVQKVAKRKGAAKNAVELTVPKAAHMIRVAKNAMVSNALRVAAGTLMLKPAV